MPKNNLSKGEIVLIPASEYFFTEIFIPLLERTPDTDIMSYYALLHLMNDSSPIKS
jgi:hypothetical protein